MVHASAFNLGVWMRNLFGIGTPRSLQGHMAAPGALLTALRSLVYDAITRILNHTTLPAPFLAQRTV